MKNDSNPPLKTTKINKIKKGNTHSNNEIKITNNLTKNKINSKKKSKRNQKEKRI